MLDARTPATVIADRSRAGSHLAGAGDDALTFSKLLSATMIASRQTGGIRIGMRQLVAVVGKVSKTLVWDRESAIGGRGKQT